MCQFVTHFFTRAFKPVHLIGCPLFRKMSLMDFIMGDSVHCRKSLKPVFVLDELEGPPNWPLMTLPPCPPMA